MNNEGIEDILISKDYNTKKKRGKGFFVVFFILLIILVAFVGAYLYLTKETVSSKELFAQNISKLNVNKLLNNEFYTTILDKIQKESSEMRSSVNFTTDLEKEELNDIDVTKFKLEISNLNDMSSQKSNSEAVLNYSGNEVFKVNLISAENEIAVASNEIMNQYVGTHKDKIKDTLGIDVNFDKINELKNTENIMFSDEEQKEYAKKYFSMIMENIPEEKFAVQENIAIENATEDVAVTNYSVTLSQDELENTLIKVLENVKNDNDLRKKITTNMAGIQKENNNQESGTTEPQAPEENSSSDIPVIKVNAVGTVSLIPSNTTQEPSVETTNNIIATENEVSNTVTETVEENVENSVNEESVENPEDLPAESENEESVEVVESTNIEELIKEENKLEEQIINLIFGKKINLSKEEYTKFVDELIEKVKKLSGNGIKINVYASEENIEKIHIVLPDESIVDIDFLQDGNSKLNSNQSYIKMTYLSNDIENSTKNGFAFEMSKEYSNASTKVTAEYSFIENEKINKKIKLDLKTEGTANSKELKNDIVITISSNKGETQVAIDNEIKFQEVTDLQGLNSENCIYLDLLPEEERKNLLDTIKTQLTNLYTSKKENLKFIDTNTYSQTTLENQNQPKPTVTKEEAQNALITKVSVMMQEAIDRGEEFTIQNLRDLEIEGYKVSSAVTQDAALIVVDVYKFNIDTGFTLTEVE